VKQIYSFSIMMVDAINTDFHSGVLDGIDGQG